MNNYVEMKLYDADSKEEFHIKVSHTDALRAERDLTFATTLLNVARQACKNTDACYDTSGHASSNCSSINTPALDTSGHASSNCSSIDTAALDTSRHVSFICSSINTPALDTSGHASSNCSSFNTPALDTSGHASSNCSSINTPALDTSGHASFNCSSLNTPILDLAEMDNVISSEKMDGDLNEEFLGENFRWSNEAVLLLLEEFKQREKAMSSGKITHKKAWDKISEAMNAKGYLVTGRQCSTRYNTMKRTYKAVKDHNNKSGNNKRTWPYYEIMDSLLGTKPYIAPILTISSTGNCTENSDSNSNNSSTFTTESDDRNFSHNGKRKKSDIASAIIESRAISEEGKTKRHKERMELKIQMMEELKNFFKK